MTVNQVALSLRLGLVRVQSTLAMIRIADTKADDAYVAHTEDGSTKYGVILFPDFMGYELVNIKLYVHL
jgi:hypothetical protein